MGLKVYDGVAVQTFQHSDGVLEWRSDVAWDHRMNSVHIAGGPLVTYRLCGHDEQWTLTSETQASYGQLPIGHYTFEVAAIDRALSHSELPAIARVKVER